MPDQLFESIDLYLKSNKEEDYKLFSEEEYQFIILAALAGSPDGVPEENLMKIIRWCENQRIGESMLNLLLQGLTYPSWNEEEQDIAFKLAEGVDGFLDTEN